MEPADVVLVGVLVCVSVAVIDVFVRVGVSVLVAVFVGVKVPMLVSVTVAVLVCVGVLVELPVGVTVEVDVLEPDGLKTWNSDKPTFWPEPPETWNLTQVIVLAAKVTSLSVPSFGMPLTLIELPSLNVSTPPLAASVVFTRSYKRMRSTI